MEPPGLKSKEIVLVPPPPLPARRAQRSLALQAVRLLPALVATPQRALFTGGLALGLAGPPLARFLATRAVEAAARSLGLAPRRARSRVEEVVVERFSATRVTVRRREA